MMDCYRRGNSRVGYGIDAERRATHRAHRAGRADRPLLAFSPLLIEATIDVNASEFGRVRFIRLPARSQDLLEG